MIALLACYYFDGKHPNIRDQTQFNFTVAYSCSFLRLMQMDTIGDAYIVATLLPPCNTATDDEAATDSSAAYNEHRKQLQTACTGALEVARAMIEAVEEYRQTSGSELRCRIGLSVGPVVAGVVGRLQVQCCCCLHCCSL
jgi:hypothetical protein